VETQQLRQAYAQFRDVVRQGDFGPPPRPDQWSAELVVAHIAESDRLIIRAIEDLLGGRPAVYDNAEASGAAELQALVDDNGGWDGLVELGERRTQQVLALAERLTDEQAATPVPTRIRDGAVMRVDNPLPWARVLTIQAQVHLPAHTQDLLALSRARVGA
jgi:hypothetical protein